ncbi:Cytochrome P450 [Apiospora hydei]|uniref:Cytochrome P450 n=1 Tax=Apiospora hydei TaxID=1337664 RepID=A0ABR1WWX4_9PEZI
MEHNTYFWAISGFAALTILILFMILDARSKIHSELWSQIDTVGIHAGGGMLSWATAIVRSVTSMQETMREGYQQFSKHHKPFALPSMWIGGGLVVLPPSMLSLLNKPRDELSSFNSLLENAQFRYLMTDRDVWANAIHFNPIRKELAPKKMGPLVAIMAEEWDGAFQQCWGKDRGGRVVNAWDSMVRIISHASLRIMVGTPGCKNNEYLHRSRLYANSVLVDGCIINCIPPMLRPVLGPLVALRAKYHQRKLLTILIPMVEEKLANIETERSNDKASPGNVIEWLIAESNNYGPEQRTALKISQRILALTSMFVFAIGWVFAHVVLDIHCSSSKDDLVNILEAECRRVWAEHTGLSTKEAIDALYDVDSAVRESMRLNDVMVHLLPLEVLRGEPIDLGGGRHISAGSGVRTVFPAQMIHTDPSIYPNPEQFDALRFTRGLEKSQDSSHTDTKRQLMTNVSTTFLPFGYGRHACPGRWFVAYMVKQSLAYVLLNYDIEVTKRPGKRTSMLNFMLPPQGAEMRVIRKEC